MKISISTVHMAYKRQFWLDSTLQEWCRNQSNVFFYVLLKKTKQNKTLRSSTISLFDQSGILMWRAISVLMSFRVPSYLFFNSTQGNCVLMPCHANLWCCSPSPAHLRRRGLEWNLLFHSINEKVSLWALRRQLKHNNSTALHLMCLTWPIIKTFNVLNSLGVKSNFDAGPGICCQC